MRTFFLSIVFVLCIAASCYSAEKEVTLQKEGDSVKVMVGDQLFTTYIIKSKTKPILWPLNAPDGSALTREPMDKPKDHPHHRSLWFSHGNVNGIDFWSETGKKVGSIDHVKFDEITSGKNGKPARIVTSNSWNGPDGSPVLTDKRELEFGTMDEVDWIDFRITLIASHGKVTFGDTKEGSFAVRMRDELIAEKKGTGHIVTSSGKTDAKAWGTRAEWVDYSGTIDNAKGEKTPIGVAILNHPESFRHPTYWHVRTYGLFAANPFGIKEFTDAKDDKHNGSYTLDADKTLVLRYRVITHKGNAESANIADLYKAYAQEPAGK